MRKNELGKPAGGKLKIKFDFAVTVRVAVSASTGLISSFPD